MIVGTAGHIDHGKTSLVRALTGTDADRLKEEKARGITIDLGFAYMPAGDGAIGFVDVPGHERLVHNMLAGASGIDLALLVVAADDGVMPQTREHLAILDLLGVTRGLVALTKTDTRVVAHEWIESHVPRGVRIAAESSTAPLAGFDVLPLELPGPAFQTDPNRELGRLERQGVRYVLVNGLVADRVLAASPSYPQEARFYHDLARRAQRVYYVRSGGDLSGPWLALYRI